MITWAVLASCTPRYPRWCLWFKSKGSGSGSPSIPASPYYGDDCRRIVSITSFCVSSSFSSSSSGPCCRRIFLWLRMVPFSSSSVPVNVSASDRTFTRFVPTYSGTLESCHSRTRIMSF